MDFSHKDGRYFLDGSTYNCPFCNRRSVKFKIVTRSSFNWNKEKKAFLFIIECQEKECLNHSLHLSFENLMVSPYDRHAFSYPPVRGIFQGTLPREEKITNSAGEPALLDDCFFAHLPTSFFTIDERIPKVIREPLSEAQNCLKNKFLTGSSGCLRKAIYKLLQNQGIDEKSTESGLFIKTKERIQLLKKKLNHIDEELFDNLDAIQGLTSQELHENNWSDLDQKTLRFLIETTKEILHEVYILPAIKKEKREKLLELKGAAKPQK